MSNNSPNVLRPKKQNLVQSIDTSLNNHSRVNSHKLLIDLFLTYNYLRLTDCQIIIRSIYVDLWFYDHKQLFQPNKISFISVNDYQYMYYQCINFCVTFQWITMTWKQKGTTNKDLKLKLFEMFLLPSMQSFCNFSSRFIFKLINKVKTSLI